MTKEGKKLLKKFLLLKNGRWYDGRTVTIHYDLDVDKFCVMKCEEPSLNITERYFTDVDAAIEYFDELYENDRVFLTDEEASCA